MPPTHHVGQHPSTERPRQQGHGTQDTYVQQTDTHRPHDDLRARDGGARGRTTRVHHAGARVAAQHAMAARKTPARAPSRIAAAPCAALSTAPTRPHARIRQRRSPRRCRTPSRAPQRERPKSARDRPATPTARAASRLRARPSHTAAAPTGEKSPPQPMRAERRRASAVTQQP